MGLIPPLAIVQARMDSTRLPGKMLKTLPHQTWYAMPSTTGGLMDRVPGPVVEETLIARGYRIACDAFGQQNVVCAIPAKDAAGPLGDELRRIGATCFAWPGPEWDVLGRFHACAHRYRWHPDSLLVRVTPDDPFKTVAALRDVAAGRRLPVELGGEAFTLGQLDAAHALPVIDSDATPALPRRWLSPREREHITHALFTTPPPPPPPGVWTVDSQADLDAARERVRGNR